MRKVVLYSGRVCPFCEMAKEWMINNNVAFDEIIVDDNPLKMKEMIKLSGQMSVPFTYIVDDNKEYGIYGFDLPSLNKYLLEDD